MNAKRAGAVLALILVVLCTLVGIAMRPRSCPLSVCPELYTGYYYGFNLSSQPGFLGRSYFKLIVPPSAPEHGFTEVDYSGPGWNQFHGTYPDGTLREEGECWVELNGSQQDPCPDLHNVRTGKYYDSAGRLVSEIQSGTGIQTYFAPNGTKIWELQLREHHRVRASLWYDNGQFIAATKYLDDKEHGEFVTYYSTGAKKREGAYQRGERIGRWVEYELDGQVKETVDYGPMLGADQPAGSSHSAPSPAEAK